MFDVKAHLINLKGKDYLQVAWRLVWFRSELPKWSIDTTLISHDPVAGHALFVAKISDEEGNQKASGHGSESIKDFRDYLEKAETKAVGRALAMLGYGTQFALLDFEERGKLITAIFAYVGGESVPKLVGATAMAFSFIKIQQLG